MRLRVLGVAALISISLAQSSPVSAGTEAPQQPTVEVVENADAETLTYGIAGAGWTPGSLVQFELCGNDARDGSVDCALGTAQIVAADAQGQVRGRLSTSPPPSLCPCVVRAVSLGSGDTATTPVRVPGVAEMPADATDVEPPPEVTELTVGSRLVANGSPWGPWIGMAPKRTLVVMVANTGNAPVDDAVLSITVGSSDPPTGFVEPVALGAFDVGEVREVEVPVELPAFTWGGYRVHGEISGTTEPVQFAESTSSYPWLLIVLAIFGAVHLALVLLRRAIRKRLPDDDPTATGGSPPAPPSRPATTVLAIGPGDRALPPGDVPASTERKLGADLVYVVEVSAGNGSAVVFELEVRDRLVHEYHDERRRRVVYTVLGLQAAKGLISAVLRSADEQAFPRWHQRRIVEMVSIPPIVTSSEEEIEVAGMELGRWLEADHGFTVYVASGCDGANLRTAIRVDDRPDFGAHLRSTSSWLRLESGVPAVTYRMQCPSGAAEPLDEVVAELRADGVLVSVDHSDADSEISVRSNHLDALAAVCDRVAASVPIRRGHLYGLIPLRMVNGVDKQTLDRLGIEAEDTYEYQLITTADARRLEAGRRALRAADTEAEASASWDAPEVTASDTPCVLARGDMAVHSVRN